MMWFILRKGRLSIMLEHKPGAIIACTVQEDHVLEMSCGLSLTHSVNLQVGEGESDTATPISIGSGSG